MNPTDKEYTSPGLATLLALPVEPATEFQNWGPDGSVIVMDESPTGPVKVNPLSDAELRLLKAVVEHPGEPSGAYCKLAGLGTHQAIAARKKLTAEGYLREHRMNTSAKGRASIVLEPLPVALEICRSGSRKGT
jgi:hypothetical protein